jgi:putative ABC transport system permease protein
MSWKRFFRRTKWDEERAQELAAHLQIESDENVSRGMLPDEARYAANRKLGNTTQIREEIYRMNSMAFVETVGQDLKFALRMLRKKPSFTIAAMLTLALGIGATTAIFSVVNSMLIKPLPYAHSSELVALTGTSARIPHFSVSLPDFTDFQQQSRSFSQMAAGIQLGLGLTGVERPGFVEGYYVTHDFLSTLGVHPMMGRDFLPEEDSAGTNPVVILSYRLWQSQMHGDPNVVGHSMQLEDHSYTIVGVLPQSFFLFETSALLAPIGLFPSQAFRTSRGNHGDTDIIGRLAPGANLSQARTEINGLAARLAQQYPETNLGYSVVLTPIREVFVSDTSTAVLVLFGAVMFVLLIACANVANLFLVRGAERTKEIAVRLAFGAGRARVVRQMLTESLVLAFVGGGIGTLLGFWSLKGLERIVPPGTFMGMGMEPHMDATVLGFVGTMIIFVSIAFGLVPALHATRPDVQEALKDGGRSSTPSAKQHRVRGALAVAETALALVLIIGAGLMLKSLSRLLNVSSGIQQDHVLTMTLNLPKAKYTKMPAISMFWQQVLDRVNALPEVQSAAIGTIVPFTGDHRRTDITIEGQPMPTTGNFPHPDYHTVSSGYFSALGIPVLSGRAFTDADTESGAPVGIINATLAKLYWPNEDPVGKHFAFGHGGANSKWVTIVGVAGDTKIYGLANPVKIEVYIPYQQRPNASMTLVVRSSGDPASLSSAVQSAISSVDKDQAVTGIYTMQQLVELAVSTRHATLVLLELFSGLALVLASIGIYGVMAYTVALRTHEIGIRMALGAQRKDVLSMVMGQGVRLALTGVAIGIAAAFGLTRLLSSLLFSVSASDPVVFVCVPLLLVLVTAVACYIPAMRAMRVDPIIALRYE